MGDFIFFRTEVFFEGFPGPSILVKFFGDGEDVKRPRGGDNIPLNFLEGRWFIFLGDIDYSKIRSGLTLRAAFGDTFPRDSFRGEEIVYLANGERGLSAEEVNERLSERYSYPPGAGGA